MARKSKPETVLCTYRVRKGKEKDFRALLERHWPALREVELASATAPIHLCGTDDEGAPLFHEIFEWRDATAHELAHQHPSVMAIWERMDTLCEARGSRPNMEFPHFERLALVAEAE